MNATAIRAVLFDLDGTLADTAPDLVAAVARLRSRLGLPEADLSALPALAGRGALALMEAGIPELDGAERERWRAAYLEDYRMHCWEASRAFDGVDDLLERLLGMGVRLGVVTNKLRGLAAPVLESAGWSDRMACLVAADDVARPKPAPDPVLAACRALGVEPAHAVLVGDDRRDIDAGRAAGCHTIAAAWGYVPKGEDPAGWAADRVIDRPVQLMTSLAELQGRGAA